MHVLEQLIKYLRGFIVTVVTSTSTSAALLNTTIHVHDPILEKPSPYTVERRLSKLMWVEGCLDNRKVRKIEHRYIYVQSIAQLL